MMQYFHDSGKKYPRLTPGKNASHFSKCHNISRKYMEIGKNIDIYASIRQSENPVHYQATVS